MLRFLASRTLLALVALWAINTIVFFLARATGDATALLIPVDASPETVQTIRASLGLDRSLPGQYGRYLWNVLHWDFGVSYRNQEPVAGLIAQRAGVSLQLTAFALVFAIIAGVPMGAMAAVRKNSWVDHVVRGIAFLGQAMPSFFLALLLVQYVARHVDWLPSGGNERWSSVILPGITLGVFLMASIARLLRASMIEAMQSEYVRMARLKGLGEGLVIWKHAVKNAVLPVLALTGMYAALSITVSVAIEVVFAWPGLGQLSFDAIVNRDLAVIQGVVIMASTLTIAVSLLVDWISAMLDPRLRIEPAGA